mgnify:CR=1 FL=1
MARETKDGLMDFELKESDGGAFISGYASTFNTIDGGRDIVHPRFFDRVIDRFRDEGAWCLFHDFKMPIGRPVEVRADSVGLFSKAAISDVPNGQIARTLARDKVLQRLSFSYEVGVADRLEKERDIEDYWREIGYNPTDQDLMAKRGGHVRLLQQAKELYEISPVTVAMNRAAVITAAKAVDLTSPPDGLTMDDHSQAVLAAVDEWKLRVADVARLRAEEGRTLSAERKSQIERLRDDLNELLRLAQDVKPEPDEFQELYVQYLATEARLRGVVLGW